MTTEDIKKAFSRFKKEATSELSFSVSGRCYMNKKQLENRTGTICLCSDIPYEVEIEQNLRDIDRVKAYDTWTAAEIERTVTRCEEEIHLYQASIDKYGTPEEEASRKYQEILHSECFDRFQNAVGPVIMTLEHISKGKGLSGIYQVRLNY